MAWEEDNVWNVLCAKTYIFEMYDCSNFNSLLSCNLHCELNMMSLLIADLLSLVRN